MPKIVNHDERKLEIAAVAVRLFIKYGVNGIGMREIAAELNVSKTHIYHYFESKDVLFSFCMRMFLEKARGFVPAFNNKDTTKTRVKKIISYYGTVTEDFGEELFLFTDHVRDLTLSERKKNKFIDRYQQRIAKTLSKSLVLDSETTQAVHQLLIGALMMAFLTGAPLNEKGLQRSVMKLIGEEP